MFSVLVVIHILACIALIMIVLLQTGRGAEMGAAFGGASQTLFGGSGGTTFLSKLTTAAAVMFMLTCLGLSYISTGPQTKSVMDKLPVETPQGPAIPDARPVQPLQEQQPAAPEASTKSGAGEPTPAQSTPVAAPQSAPAAVDSASTAGAKKTGSSQDQGKQQKKTSAPQTKQQ